VRDGCVGRRYHDHILVLRPSTGHVYFHAPCFDGIASAVLVWDFFEVKRRWRAVRLHPVNYEIAPRWLARRLSHPCAVVDFLYHPRAEFWADHHVGPFVTPDAEAHFRRRARTEALYSPSAGSCAEVIWRLLKVRFGYRNDRYRTLVHWAAKLDAAKYRTVEEAVYARSPAPRIARTLVLEGGRRYASYLVRRLKVEDLNAVAASTPVRRRYEQTQSQLKRGLAQVERSLNVEEDGIVTFEATDPDAFVTRYFPYVFKPKAPYVAGIIRESGGLKVTAHRNPWLGPGVVSLGNIVKPFGGGGHHQVGSVMLRDADLETARDVLQDVLAEIRRESAGRGRVAL
jgi:hypothetical protein